MSIRQIALPIDFSESSAAVAHSCVALAQATGARVGLIHVTESPPLSATWPGEFAQQDQDLLAKTQAGLASYATGLDLPGDGHSCSVRRGPAGINILAAAADMRADLIMMGSLGTHNDSSMLGSVTARVARDANCPVLVLRKEHKICGLFERPLVAVDYSQFSEPCVDFVSNLVTPSASIELCHCLFQPHFDDMDGEARKRLETLVGAAQKHQSDKLHAFVEYLKNREGKVLPQKLCPHLAIGRATDGVLARATEIQADLVVTGAHGRQTSTDLLLGSVADRMLRRAPTPVLLIPDGAVA